jgi:hypothetical protein
MDEKLLEAAELIENNFVRYHYQQDGSYCLDGAIMNVYGWSYDHGGRLMGGDYKRSIARVARVLPLCDPHSKIRECAILGKIGDRLVGGLPSALVHHYNDHHCHGGIEAAKILREAAEVEL